MSVRTPSSFPSALDHGPHICKIDRLILYRKKQWHVSFFMNLTKKKAEKPPVLRPDYFSLLLFPFLAHPPQRYCSYYFFLSPFSCAGCRTHRKEGEGREVIILINFSITLSSPFQNVCLSGTTALEERSKKSSKSYVHTDLKQQSVLSLLSLNLK